MSSAAPALAVRALTCPNCGGAIEMRAAGSTVSFICPHCGSTLDATDRDLALLTRAHKAMKRPRIALGTRGTIEGTEWQAVGYMERVSEDGGWSEYLLFNPYRGYRFLVDSDDGFYLGELLDRAPEGGEDRVTLDGNRFTLDEPAYPARVTFVVGEFYWRVAVGETVDILDYSGPGGISLSAETNEQERTWTRSRRLDGGKVMLAFGIQQSARATRPPGPGSAIPGALLVAFLTVVALLIVSAAGYARRPLLASGTIDLPVDGPTRMTVITPITLTEPDALTIETRGGRLSNQWVEYDYSLVDRRTQTSYDSSAVAEYYSGGSGDDSWSEGDSSPHTALLGVPAGTYDLIVEASARNWPERGISSFGTGETITSRIRVRRGVSSMDSFWFSLFLVALWPGFLIWRAIKRKDEED
ncbi:DUF4178 domain-containing protein [Sphingomonas jatrophae]|uniref:DUF4178 domain-containing protein n=1 Tax=Sphingomonas jatrophae TaxID=1166337 RepID=A0A1I6K1E6_9SPHN|nr:DUF4178 domain-containing protein [Sphingomonas jatrophae]SFR84640.1 protein of unknown function [Sphingomonas jatrophae]